MHLAGNRVPPEDDCGEERSYTKNQRKPAAHERENRPQERSAHEASMKIPRECIASESPQKRKFAVRRSSVLTEGGSSVTPLQI